MAADRDEMDGRQRISPWIQIKLRYRQFWEQYSHFDGKSEPGQEHDYREQAAAQRAGWGQPRVLGGLHAFTIAKPEPE